MTPLVLWIAFVVPVAVGGLLAAPALLRGYPSHGGERERAAARRALARNGLGMAVAALLPPAGPIVERRLLHAADSGAGYVARLESAWEGVWRSTLALALSAPLFAELIGRPLLDRRWSLALYALAVLFALWGWVRWLVPSLLARRRRARADSDRARCPACGEHALVRRVLSVEDGSYTGRGESVGMGQSSYTYEHACRRCDYRQEGVGWGHP